MQIPALVHFLQSGFTKGRSIVENFVMDADMVQTTHKRKVPMVVLKLDFQKVFDTVSWSCTHAFLVFWKLMVFLKGGSNGLILFCPRQALESCLMESWGSRFMLKGGSGRAILSHHIFSSWSLIFCKGYAANSLSLAI